MRLTALQIRLVLWACFTLIAAARPAYAELRIIDPTSAEEAQQLEEQAKRFKIAVYGAAAGKPITQQNQKGILLGFLIALPEAEKERLNIYTAPLDWIIQEVKAGRSIPVHRAYLNVWRELVNDGRPSLARTDAIEKQRWDARDIRYQERAIFEESGWNGLANIAHKLQKQIETRLNQNFAQEEKALPDWQVEAMAKSSARRTAGPPTTENQRQWKNESPGFFGQYNRGRLYWEQETEKQNAGYSEEKKETETKEWLEKLLIDATAYIAEINVRKATSASDKGSDLARLRKRINEFYGRFYLEHGFGAIRSPTVAKKLLNGGSLGDFNRHFFFINSYLQETLRESLPELFKTLQISYQLFLKQGNKALPAIWNQLGKTAESIESRTRSSRDAALEYQQIPAPLRGQIDADLRALLMDDWALRATWSAEIDRADSIAKQQWRPSLRDFVQKGSSQLPYLINKSLRIAKYAALTTTAVAAIGLAGVETYKAMKLIEAPSVRAATTTAKHGIELLHDQDYASVIPEDKPTVGKSDEKSNPVFRVKSASPNRAIPENYFIPEAEDLVVRGMRLVSTNPDHWPTPYNAMVIESLVPAKFQKTPDGSYAVPLLRPDGFKIASVRLLNNSNPSDVGVYETSRGDYALVVSGNRIAEAETEVTYVPANSKELPAAKPPALIEKQVLKEIEALRSTGMTKLADRLTKSLKQAKAANRPMDLLDALTEFGQENYKKGSVGKYWARLWGGTHYDRFRKFLGEDGSLNYTCNNAKGIFETFAKKTLSPEDFKHLRTQSLFKADGDGNIGDDGIGHVRLEWNNSKTTSPLVLDPTPAEEPSPNGKGSAGRWVLASERLNQEQRSPVSAIATVEKETEKDQQSDSSPPKKQIPKELFDERRRRSMDLVDQSDDPAEKPLPENSLPEEGSEVVPATKAEVLRAEAAAALAKIPAEFFDQPAEVAMAPAYNEDVERAKIAKLSAIAELSEKLVAMLQAIDKPDPTKTLAQQIKAKQDLLKQLTADKSYPLIQSTHLARLLGDQLLGQASVADQAALGKSIQEAAKDVLKTLQYILEKDGKLSTVEKLHRLPHFAAATEKLANAIAAAPTEPVHPEYLADRYPNGCSFHQLADKR